MQTLNNQSITNLLHIIRNLLGKLIESEKQKELCWAAGLVDGEGCITAVKQTYKPKNLKELWKVDFLIGKNSPLFKRNYKLFEVNNFFL